MDGAVKPTLTVSISLAVTVKPALAVSVSLTVAVIASLAVSVSLAVTVVASLTISISLAVAVIASLAASLGPCLCLGSGLHRSRLCLLDGSCGLFLHLFRRSCLGLLGRSRGCGTHLHAWSCGSLVSGSLSLASAAAALLGAVLGTVYGCDPLLGRSCPFLILAGGLGSGSVCHTAVFFHIILLQRICNLFIRLS